MWTDEVCTIDDIPEPGAEKLYATGLYGLDAHGFRLVRPAFMPVIGPYGSGKSVLLRQLAVNLWRQYRWRTLITSFEEKVKPRFHRDLRRHIIGHPAPWTDEQVAYADAEIRLAFRFLRRKRNTVLDMDRLIDRIEYAVRVYGVDVVIIDPVNEIDHMVPRGETKSDYMGRFIMRLKQIADDYSLLMIVAAHPPKDGVEKRLSKNGLLTLNDGADTAHYGNKADIGWCVWRNYEGPTLLHIDKLKDHESMGKPTLCELHLDPTMNQFTVGRVGYDILDEN
ncbi:AAA family ATPase [Hyphomicrobium sp. 2TAF46]|uniref:AAA family ATPase n=1 Tax=Hyphomicrobium sp. 2TAF46 TaxID=3233019 RepID=UPI003F90215D